MILKHLSLTQFRNFARLETPFPEGPTIVVGANAQGKTNLLEAIYYLTGATSTHAGSDRELINFLTRKEPVPVARIVAEVESRDRLRRIEIRIILEAVGGSGEGRVKKEVLIDGLKSRIRDLAGVFNAVSFLPQDMEIIEGSPSKRRRFIDESISQADPAYSAALSEYRSVLPQRNALLKQLQEKGHDEAQLSFWDEQVSELAATLIRSRALALIELDRLATPIHQNLTQDVERLQFDYLPSYDPTPKDEGQLDLPLQALVDRSGVQRGAIRDGMLKALREARQEEISRGMTLIGPHRDDFRVLSNGIDLRLYGSRGQNRTALLAAKLAEVEWLRERTNEWPLFLLDEMLAELDTHRRDDLLKLVGSVHQSILTSADLTMFDQSFIDQSTVWQITGGRLEPL